MNGLLISLLLTAASPEARKVAVLVGANGSVDGRGELRFAHHDAERMAAALVSVSGFAAADVHVLKDPEPEAVLAMLDASTREPSAVVLFYFSGHADPQALYTAGKPLQLVDVKQRLEAAPSTLRLGIVDACHGGGWTRAKGLVPVTPKLKLVSSEGSALLASSSGLERAHESDLLQGSFFTHHLVAALRGAAEQTASGEITLQAAFRYAEQHTVHDSALYAGQAQHPSFELNLRGRTDVVLAQVGGGEAQLEVAQTEGPLQLVALKSGTMLLELPAGERRVRLAVEPGGYLLRRETSGGVLARELHVESGKTLDVDEASLTLVGQPMLAAKQMEADAASEQRHLELNANWVMPIAGGGSNDVTQLGLALAAAWRFDTHWAIRARGSWAFVKSPNGASGPVDSDIPVTEALFGVDGVFSPLVIRLGSTARFEAAVALGSGAAIARDYRITRPPTRFTGASAPRVLFAPLTLSPSFRFFFGDRVAVGAEANFHWVVGSESSARIFNGVVVIGLGVTVAL